MTINYRIEVDSLREDTEKLHALAIRMATVITDIRDRVEELHQRLNAVTDLSPLCRHDNPIGDYCAYCAETPEG